MDTAKQSTNGAEEVLAFSTTIIGRLQEEAEDCIARYCKANDLPELRELIDQYAYSFVLLYNYQLSPNTWIGFSNESSGIEAINHDISYNFMELTKAMNKLNRKLDEKKAQAA